MKQFLDSLQFNTWAALIVFGSVVIAGALSVDYAKSKNVVVSNVISGLIKLSIICITAIILKMLSLDEVYCWVILIYVIIQTLSEGRHLGFHLLALIYLIKFAIFGAVALFSMYAAYKILIGLGHMVFS